MFYSAGKVAQRVGTAKTLGEAFNQSTTWVLMMNGHATFSSVLFYT